MFKFSIESSSKLKKLTIEFDNQEDSVEIVGSRSVEPTIADQPEKSINSSSMDVLADRLAQSYVPTKSSDTPVDDGNDVTKDRPPLVDTSFGSQSF